MPLVVNYFASAARPGALTHRAARRRLLRLRHTSGCLSRSRGLSRRLVVDCFAYLARPGAGARRAARLAARRRLLRLRRTSGCLGKPARLVAQAHRRVLHLRRASGCFSTSRGSSRGQSHRSSWTTSPPPLVRVPRHIARLVTRLLVDYFDSRRLVVDCFAYAARPGASARRAARLAARRRLLRLRRASGCLGTSRGSSRRSP
jgi:hypothetical protein